MIGTAATAATAPTGETRTRTAIRETAAEKRARIQADLTERGAMVPAVAQVARVDAKATRAGNGAADGAANGAAKGHKLGRQAPPVVALPEAPPPPSPRLADRRKAQEGQGTEMEADLAGLGQLRTLHGAQLETAAQAVGVMAPARFEALPASTLQIDHAYQRDLTMSWVNALRMDFSWAKFGSLVVNRRADGFYYVVSGQHRHAAVMEKFGGGQLLPCLVYEGMSQRQEAALYLSLDADRRTQQPFDLYRAKLASGDRNAHEVRKILAEFGMGLATSWRDAGAEGRLASVSTIQRLYANKGAARLRTVMRVLIDAYGMTRMAFQQHMISGLSQFFDRYYGQADLGTLAAALKKKGIDEIQRQARALGTLSGMGGGSSLSRGVMVAAQVFYNELERDRRRKLPSPLAPQRMAPASRTARMERVGGRQALIESESD